MLDYTTKSGVLHLYEVGNGIMVEHVPTGRVHHCGNGTQWMENLDWDAPVEECEKVWHANAIADIEGSESEWVEAYFGE